VSCRIITLEAEPEFVGRAVCAIGVFDGVHAGHQALVRDAVALAEADGVEAFVITFDRDPDQVVTPQSAAPQLLTLAHKAELLCEVGADAVLVVPFTEQIAALSPTEFLSEILLSAVDPVAVVVGEDFRFGHRAEGTVETLKRFCEPRGIAVQPHALVEREDAPVTSTRIRSLVAAGDVVHAADLLGRLHRVHGEVVRGRGEGAALGVPTANVEPVPFAALPASGVYAGRVVVNGRSWPAAISVGRPPSFPDAVDVLEAHLIGFDGDIYGFDVTVEFAEKLRDQRAFDSVQELTTAMQADIETALVIGASLRTSEMAQAARDIERSERDWADNPFVGLAEALLDTITGPDDEGEPDLLDDGTPVVEDPGALEAAERAAAGKEPVDRYGEFDDTWVKVLGPVSLPPMSGPITAFKIAAPLEAAGIPYVWDPFSPQELSSARPDMGNVIRFSIWVPPEFVNDARAVLDPLWSEPRG